ncbi:cytidylate kinase family protein [Geobacter hydrogenophilus]|uniref:Transporter n=1 Tax=Geobacter hydrogenophilus TaxID=40983 RepID=A0A9W6G2E0_9BACT|nr:cytidylate kinase family protein [Geobacter hydrogenophilus]MBT0892958.1 cytidylate kinase family protein [Geobacter hydrogenophilus]GLI39206.1 transporter [Geobacter hydrogenophilus]
MAIITISREMGTGAYQIAREVAKRLKHTLVDGAKIAELAPQYGLDREILNRVDEKPPVYITAEDRLQAAHLNTIEIIMLDCARKGNVILYGRGSQDLLADVENILRLRFVAPFEDRVESLSEREWIDPELARVLIRKSDHQRGGFIHFYFNRDWNDTLGYDLIFNTSRMSQGAIVESIVAAAKDPRLKNGEEKTREIVDDIVLCKKIETELFRSSTIENLHFKISAQKDVVRLAGHVYSDGEREDVLRIVAGVKGVTSIDDDLQVVSYKPYKE